MGSNHRIRFSDLAMKSRILEDESGSKASQVVDRRSGTAYVLEEFSRRRRRAEINREFEILKGLDHPNLVKCYELFEMDDRIYLLFEYVDRGSIIGVDITSLDELAGVAYQVLLALSYLHQNKISHGDLKPSNIFVTSTNQVKVLCLGQVLSKAPSAIGAVHDEFSWDVWNLGLSILKFYQGLRKRFKEVDFEKAYDTESLIEMCRFLMCCMRTDSSQRWTARALVRHPFFKFCGTNASKRTAGAESFVSLSSLSSGEEGCISPRMKKQKTSMEDELDPDSLVRCIQHCALFSPDCEFGKDKLVQMWIAEGCIEVEGTKRAEDIAGLYFDALVHQEVLIPSKYQGLKYKVNTSQASTQFLKQGQYLRVDDANLGEIQGEALHLRWHCEKLDQTLSHALKHFEQLRTLRVVVDSVFLNKQLPCGITGILLGLKNLINLDLSRAHILELPIAIGLVKTLKFFDVSENPIKQLPESTRHLSSLQTLKLKGCVGVRELPREFRNLKKLRHLDLDIVRQLTSMPKGMGDLTELQTLQGFIVGKDDGRGIRELKNMNEITGRFCITRLENVSSAEEAKEASLADKKLIDKLKLRWCNPGDEPSHDTAEILECLRPHFHLRELGIIGFSGWKLPSWISNPYYVELASITLFCCTGCHFLPSIGKLPSLKILTIIDMDNVRDINTLFYPRTGNQRFNAFPRLEKLTLNGMLNLEKWTGVEDGDLPCLNQLSITSCPKLTILPSMSGLRALRHLEVICCPQLISLPEGLSLESLIIGECPKVKERCRRDGGEDWVKIANVRELWID